MRLLLVPIALVAGCSTKREPMPPKPPNTEQIGIRFTKVDDACERRAKIDGETWYRIR